jgi:hypothetical protein
MDILTNPDYNTIGRYEIAEVRQSIHNMQKGLFSLRRYSSDEMIMPFAASAILTIPTYLTIQTGIRKHITLLPEYLQYINHSCCPNVFFDTTTMQLIALKEIQPGDEFTFFYPSTEWKMAQPFRCYCGTSRCIGEIRGAFYLTNDVLGRYRLTDFIKNQLAQKAARKKVA